MKNYMAIICCIAMLALTACNRLQEKPATTQPPLPVEVLSVGHSADAGSRTYIGKICPAAEFPLYYAIGGQLLRLHVESGERVRRGQAIADFDDTQARALYASAEAVLQQAEDGYRRMQPLREKGVVTEVQWVEMQTNLEKARQSAKAAAKSLSDCHITAPQDGVIGSVDAHVGQHMLPGQSVCSLLDVNTLEAEFTVPEQDIRHISVGDTAVVRINALDSTFLAVVSSKNMTANPIAHTYTLRARLIKSTVAQSSLGGSVSVQLTLATPQQDNRIIIPGRCVHTTPSGPMVWVAENGFAYRRPIEIGRYVADGVEVTSGLHTHDQIIISGYQKLYNGASVTF